MRKVMCCLTSVMVVVMLIGFSTGVVGAGTCELPVFNLSDFDSAQDNDYLPMPDSIDGHTYVYEAETEDGLIRDYQWFYTPSSSYPHATILGVDITVVYDVEYLWVEDPPAGPAWVKLEETDDWHAWDYLGNFWYFGEETTEYLYDDDWVPVYPYTSPAGSWKAGVASPETGIIAQPGIILLADPHRGDCVQQEYAPDDALDRGKVLRLNAKVSIEYGDYEDCEMTKEFTPYDPGNIEHKYYAPGVGLVYIEELKEKTVKVELVGDYDGPPQDFPPTIPPSP